MIGRDDLDLASQHLAAKVLHRHLRGGLRAHAGDIGIKPGHVENATKLERRLALRQRHSRRHCQYSGDNACCCSFHGGLPVDATLPAALKFSARSCRMESAAARRGRRQIFPCFPLSGMTARMTRHGYVLADRNDHQLPRPTTCPRLSKVSASSISGRSRSVLKSARTVASTSGIALARPFAR